jgi:hypothetical protein
MAFTLWLKLPDVHDFNFDKHGQCQCVLLSSVASNASTIYFLWVCIEHLSNAFFCFKDLITHQSYRW